MEKNNNSSLDSLMEQLLSAISPSLAAAVGQAIPDDGSVTITMTKDAYEKQQAALAEVAQLKSKLRVAEERISAYEAERKQLVDGNNRQLNHINHLATELTVVRRALQAAKSPVNQRAEYNKLRKDYTACRNQRDSFANTIGVQKQTIDEMRATIKKLQANPPAPCDVLIVDSVPYDPADIRKIVEVSNNRDRENGQLLHDLATMITLRDNAVKAGEALQAKLDSLPDHAKTLRDKDSQIAQYKKLYEDTVKLNERLRNDIKVYFYNGKPISDERLKQLCDLGGAAEEAGFTIDTINNLRKQARPAVAFEDGRIVIHDVNNTHLELHTANGQTIKVDAALIPKMAEDINVTKSRADRLEGDLITVMGRNNHQAAALRAANRRISDLQETVKELNKRIAEKDADIRRLTIERNLTRGQLNELRALKTPAKVNGQVLQAGEAYMTTSLGMLPINSEGMRKLSDALDAYRAKVASLTKGLQEWIKA